MELEEWEYLSDDDRLHHPHNTLSLLQPQGASVSPQLVIPVPLEFDISIPKSPPTDDPAVKEEIPIPSGSQVFFKKLKGNEFADMKLDSPRSASREFGPQFDMGSPNFGEDDGDSAGSDEAYLFDFDREYEDPDGQKAAEDDENRGGLSIWKMGMSGVGAVCSLGFACAAIVVIVLGARRRGGKQLDQDRIHFRVYADEKRVEEAVQHAIKLNNGIRGVLPSRADMAVAGYFD